MSLTFNPYGLSFYDYKGGTNRMSTSTYTLASGYAANIGQGDPVTIGIAGNIGANILPIVPTPPNQVGAQGTILGQFLSASWVSATGVAMNNQPYWPYGTLTLNNEPAIVTVADLFSNVYKIQCNATLTSNATFKNYNISSTDSVSPPNPRTSQSTAYLDVSSYIAAPNYWLDAKIVGLAPPSMGGSNDWSDPYPEVLIMINSHAYKPGTNGL